MGSCAQRVHVFEKLETKGLGYDDFMKTHPYCMMRVILVLKRAAGGYLFLVTAARVLVIILACY